MSQTPEKKTCFVVMGFGEKTDFETQRVLDLDKTYRIIIKRAVEEAGLECVRADDVIHAGVIDKPMYEYLVGADVVVADLSTSNANAIYELGVRHALRPFTTIVIAESRFKFPFDVGHLLIRPYEHLGKGIDAEEAERVRAELKTAIATLVAGSETDSPVYTFLPALKQPAMQTSVAAAAPAAAEHREEDASLSALMDLFQEARAKSDFLMAKRYLQKLRERRPGDPYIIQQLALATYKSKDPDVRASLFEAHELLKDLRPASSNDPETLGLWGAVHKRLWEEDDERRYLEEAIRAYERGFYLRNDHYNGINYAFLLNVRATVSEPPEAIADFVLAKRVRRSVIRICEELLAAGLRNDAGDPDLEAIFWLRATLVEARIGVGDTESAESLRARAVEDAPEPWMKKSMDSQIAKLQSLLENSPLTLIAKTG